VSWLGGPVLSLALYSIRKLIHKRANFDIKDLDIIRYAKTLDFPVIFLHGEYDDFVKSHHSIKLFDAYKGTDKKLIKVKGNHNSFRVGDFYDPISEFIYRIVPQIHKNIERPFLLNSDNHVYYCKKFILSQTDEDQLEKIEKENSTANNNNNNNNIQTPNSPNKSELNGGNEAVANQYDKWQNTVVIQIGSDSINIYQYFTKQLLKTIEFHQIKAYFQYQNECFIIITREEKMYFCTPESPEIINNINKIVNEKIKVMYGSLTPEQIVENLSHIIDKLLEENNEHKKTDPKKVVAQLLKELKDIVPLVSEQEAGIEEELLKIIKNKQCSH